MTAALFNNQGGNFANVVDAYVYPQFIGYALRAPSIQDIYPAGTRWQDNSVNPAVIYQTTGAGLWYVDTASGGTFSSLNVVGPSSLTGATNVNTSGAGATNIGTGGTGGVNIGNTTGNTAVTGNMAVAGNVTFASAANGVVMTPATATGASPQTANGRAFSVTFSGVSIAAGATQSFVINNSSIAGASTVILYSLIGGTTGAGVNIQSVTNAAGSSTVVLMNSTGATTSTANVNLIGLILN